MAHWRAVARCMRRHGVSGFPDPATSVPSNPAGKYGMIASRDGAILAIPATINTSFDGIHAGRDHVRVDDARPHQALARRTTAGARTTREQLLIQSGIALAGMSLLSLGLGWLMAGRVLQPLEDSYQRAAPVRRQRLPRAPRATDTPASAERGRARQPRGERRLTA